MATLLLLALSIFSRMLGSTSQVRAVGRERALAAEAARGMLERLHNEPLREVFALYNASPEDDPGGAGSAPGNRFAVAGLRPTEGSDDGLVGEVVFPAVWESLDDRWLEDPDVLAELERAVASRGAGRRSVGGGSDAFVAEGLWTLREDVELPALGMPRDLNGDGRIDSIDHRFDALAIPVLVRIRWQGRHGERVLEVAALLTEFGTEVAG